jgi:5-oxoprolinase (ATP-hydrolysing)
VSKLQVYFDGGRQETSIYKLEDLSIGDRISGPAIIADGTQTIVVPPGSTALIIETHVVINIGDENTQTKANAEQVDPILLSIFAHRFMAIAEQMGRALQKTSVSTNVKERLDYSCALFDAEGGLVANAPHLPVHLGSMSTCVRMQASIWKGKLKKGDVIVSNHPEYGGTHLPDITVVTPAFSSSGEIVFYVASRAHHADIGGILPGSMPPHSRELYQEGAAIKSEKLVSEGHFNEERITELLYDEPAQYPDCSGTRCLADNINDLKAQIAANQKGINLISTLISDYGDDVVQFYMHAIQANAESSVRALLKEVSKRFEGKALEAVDYMDDGSPICLKITIDGEKGEAVFDFAGTGPEVYGNTNAPEAVTYSAIIYCLRCLIEQDIPLNQGCLKPVTVKIPKDSFLSPSEKAAVVGGNVLTSQRVTDVVFKCFEACAASQGDCNNLTFGYGGNLAGAKEEKGFG